MKEQMVCLTVNGQKTQVVSGKPLSFYLHAEKPCGGHGKCGKCKVRAVGSLSPVCDAEKRHLFEKELQAGMRLACMAELLGDCEIFTQEKEAVKIAETGIQPKMQYHPMFVHYGAAVDIGTTTLVARLYRKDGRMLAAKSELNPQIKWGADVVSRMEAAQKGEAKALKDALCRAIDKLLFALLEEAEGAAMDAVVITGNTVMLHFLMGYDTEPLTHAPFETEHLFGGYVTAEEAGLGALAPKTPIYLPSCISAFVGADMVCAMVATEFCHGDETKLLADIGTNGEIGLWHQGTLTVCSTAAGPAFEGVGISCGMRGEAGAIDRVWIAQGKMHIHTIGEKEPKGICGSGLVDGVSCMLTLGLLEENGYMESPVVLSEKVSLCQEDIRGVQLAKSAICAGIQTLTETMWAKSVDTLLIAGGFGSAFCVESAENIGLIPKGYGKKAQCVGNCAIEGAAAMLLCKDLCEAGEKVARDANMLSLATSPLFCEKYMQGMMF